MGLLSVYSAAFASKNYFSELGYASSCLEPPATRPVALFPGRASLPSAGNHVAFSSYLLVMR